MSPPCHRSRPPAPPETIIGLIGTLWREASPPSRNNIKNGEKSVELLQDFLKWNGARPRVTTGRTRGLANGVSHEGHSHPRLPAKYPVPSRPPPASASPDPPLSGLCQSGPPTLRGGGGGNPPPPGHPTPVSTECHGPGCWRGPVCLLGGGGQGYPPPRPPARLGPRLGPRPGRPPGGPPDRIGADRAGPCRVIYERDARAVASLPTFPCCPRSPLGTLSWK